MNRISKWFQRISPTLRELILGIFCWGFLLGLVFVWMASSKASFLLSLLAGVLAAAVMAVHMNRVIEESLEMLQEDAGKHMAKGAALRFGLLIVLLLVLVFLGGDVAAVFLGLITLKLGAYTQPLLHKLICKIYRKEEGR